MSKKYGIKYFYDITDKSDFRANPDYKGVCHIAMAQEGHCLPGIKTFFATLLQKEDIPDLYYETAQHISPMHI